MLSLNGLNMPLTEVLNGLHRRAEGKTDDNKGSPNKEDISLQANLDRNPGKVDNPIRHSTKIGVDNQSYSIPNGISQAFKNLIKF